MNALNGGEWRLGTISQVTFSKFLCLLFLLGAAIGTQFGQIVRI
jgi:hypothetical protein